jgi:hypothetical protein
VLEKFGEPLSRLVEFLSVVVEVVVTLVLELMQFPSELLASILANAKAAMEDIQADPVGFLVNMLQALKAGFTAFLDNVVTHLTQGLADWLLRGLGQLGISVPSDTSLQSILDLGCRSIGVTAETLWTKLPLASVRARRRDARRAGRALRRLAVHQGRPGARHLGAVDVPGGQARQPLGHPARMAKDWIVTEIFEAAAAKLLSMLDPTGIMAVVNSFIAFFRAVQSAVEYLREILELIEQYTAPSRRWLPATSHLAPPCSSRGSPPPSPSRSASWPARSAWATSRRRSSRSSRGLRQLIDEALEWLFDQAMRLGQAALNALGIGGEAEEEAAKDDPPGTPLTEEQRTALYADVAATLGAEERKVTSKEQTTAMLSQVFAQYRPRGLKEVSLVASDPKKPWHLEVHAHASPACASAASSWTSVCASTTSTRAGGRPSSRA